jgi:hypothetical protein
MSVQHVAIDGIGLHLVSQLSEYRGTNHCSVTDNRHIIIGDYVVKTIVGAIDPTVHMVDLPNGGCPTCCCRSCL